VFFLYTFNAKCACTLTIIDRYLDSKLSNDKLLKFLDIKKGPPNYELKDFKRVKVPVNQSVKVSFILDATTCYNYDKKKDNIKKVTLG